jgi:hypothetical protein
MSTSDISDSANWASLSYTEQLQLLADCSCHGQVFEWLNAFMKTLPPNAAPRGIRPRTTALIADALPGGWKIWRLVDQCILAREDNVHFRVILLECESERMAWIDRKYVETIALFYHINPVYLWGVFQKNRVDEHYPPNSFLGNYVPVPFDAPDYAFAGITALEVIHSLRDGQSDQLFVALPSMSCLMLSDGSDEHCPTCT